MKTICFSAHRLPTSPHLLPSFVSRIFLYPACLPKPLFFLPQSHLHSEFDVYHSHPCMSMLETYNIVIMAFTITYNTAIIVITIILDAFKLSYSFRVECPSQAHLFKSLDPNCWCCLGFCAAFKRWGRAGGCESLENGPWGSSSVYFLPKSLLLLCFWSILWIGPKLLQIQGGLLQSCAFPYTKLPVEMKLSCLQLCLS